MLVAATANPAAAQDKAKAAKAEKEKVTVTVLAESDKVRVQEIRQKPGEENTGIETSSYRVVRALKGGTLSRTYADGRMTKKVWKTGEVEIQGPDNGKYTTKNVGKSEVVLYVVVLK
jgi:hypothetical protein